MTVPTWIASSGEWDDSANWSGGVPRFAGDIAAFSFSGNSSAHLVGINGPSAIRLGTLNVSMTGTAGLTVQGAGRLIFDNGASNAVVTVNSNAAQPRFTISGAGGLVVELASDVAFNFNGAFAKAYIDAPIVGTGALIAGPDFSLYLTGNNNFSGGLQVIGSFVQASGDVALGSGAVTIEGGSFISQGVIDNDVIAVGATAPYNAVANISALAGTTMTLSGNLTLLTDSFLLFGFDNNSGKVVAAFSSIVDNPSSHFTRVQTGILQVGNDYSAANLFSRWTMLGSSNADATIDTNGFETHFKRGLYWAQGTLMSSSGALNVVIGNPQAPSNTDTERGYGTLVGTAFADRYVVYAAGNYDFSTMTINSWSANDLIQINGNGGDNRLTGSTKADEINGGGGNDIIIGFGGIDTLNGGDGDDRIEVMLANNGSALSGGAGVDTLRATGSGGQLAPFLQFIPGSVSGFEIISLAYGMRLTNTQFTDGFAPNTLLTGFGTITVDMAPGSPQLFARLMTVQSGSNISFTINGSSGADVVKASLATANTIFGNDGTDILIGGNLADTIYGGNGNDKIRGEGGGDMLTGGAGADVFKFRAASDSGTEGGADTITDFVSGTDRLNFSAIDTDAVVAGDQGFTYVGTGAFSGGGAASIRYVDLGDDLRVEADVNGDGVADMHILLQGAGAGVLTAADFVL